jgi:ankyrin repeat protein
MSNSVVSEEQFILDYFNSKYNITCSNIHDEIKRNEFNVEYKTLLYIACEKGDYDICKLLISNNADVNNLSTISTYLYMKKVSALYAACEYANRSNNDISIVKLLLDVDNIDVNIGDLNPLGYCCEYDNVKIAKLLLKHKNIDVNKKYSPYEKDTALIASCKKGNTELVELLLGNDNIDVNKIGSFGRNALFESCRIFTKTYNEEDEKIANMLLNNPKIDINAENHYGETVIHIFSDDNFAENNTILIELLKREEIDINKQLKRSGNTILHLAVIENNISLMKLLIKIKKLDLNKFNKEGYTPLNIAVKNRFTQICELLVKNKCNIDLSNYDFIPDKIQVKDEIIESILRSGEILYDINNINNNLICKKRKLSMIL